MRFAAVAPASEVMVWESETDGNHSVDADESNFAADEELTESEKGRIKYESGCTPAIRSSPNMQFCPKCSLALIPTKKEKIVVLACPKCGEETRRALPIVQKFGKARESVVVIGKEDKNLQTLPTTKVTCQKCGHGEAFYWMVQTRGGDEASTQFFRCTKCGTTWRESS